MEVNFGVLEVSVSVNILLLTRQEVTYGQTDYGVSLF